MYFRNKFYDDDDRLFEAEVLDTLDLKSKLEKEMNELALELDRIVQPKDYERAIRTIRHTKSLIALRLKPVPTIQFGAEERRPTLKRKAPKQSRGHMPRYKSTRKKPKKRKNALRNPSRSKKQELFSKYYS